MKSISLVLALLAACRPPAKQHARDLLAKFAEFRDRMCACQDKSCVDKVQDDLTRWTSEAAKQPGRDVADYELAKQIAEVTKEFTDCQTRANAVMGGEAPLPAEPIFDADRIVKLTYEQKGSYVVSELSIWYVDAQANVDATYGRLETELGRVKPPDPADDPKRPIGAPVTPRPVDPAIIASDCPHYTWQAGKRDRRDTGCLAIHVLERPRCSVRQVWQRAITDGAPAKGLASIQLEGTDAAADKPQQWRFSIEDVPRGIHFDKEYRDDCQPIVEKPPP